MFKDLRQSAWSQRPLFYPSWFKCFKNERKEWTVDPKCMVRTDHSRVLTGMLESNDPLLLCLLRKTISYYVWFCFKNGLQLVEYGFENSLNLVENHPDIDQEFIVRRPKSKPRDQNPTEIESNWNWHLANLKRYHVEITL